MIFLTTTSIEIDEELANRCLILTVDESREQARRIPPPHRGDRCIRRDLDTYLSRKRLNCTGDLLSGSKHYVPVRRNCVLYLRFQL